MTLKTRLLSILLLSPLILFSCSTQKTEPESPDTPDEPQPQEEVVWGDTTPRVFTVSFSQTTKIGFGKSSGYRWQEGDVIIVSNCNSDVTLKNGVMEENPDACQIAVTPEMIAEDGASVCFETTVPSAPEYCIVAASKAKSIASVSKDGVITADKLSANSSGVLPYIASCKGEGNSFLLNGNVRLACFTVTAIPVYNLAITVGGTKHSVYVTQHPTVVYFPMDNVSSVTVKASSVSGTLFNYTFKGISLPEDGSILDLGDLCAFAGMSDRYDRWQAGLPFSIAGEPFDKASWGDAKHVKRDTIVHNASGAWFIDPGATLSVTGTAGDRFAAFSNEEGTPASLSIGTRLNGNVAFDGIRFGGSAQRMFSFREATAFALFENCVFEGPDFMSVTADIEKLSFNKCVFCSKDMTEMSLADCEGARIDGLSLEGCVFYNRIPVSDAFINAPSVDKLSIRNNIVYLAAPAGKQFSLISPAMAAASVSDNVACGTGCNIALPDACPGQSLSGPVTDPFTRKDFESGIFEYDLSRAVGKDVVAQILECRTPEASFCLENRMVREFVTDIEYDTDYSYTRIYDYFDYSEDWQAPLPVTLSLDPSCATGKQFVLSVTEDGDLNITDGGTSSTVEIYNLKPGKTYSYGIFSTEDGRLLRKGAFSTEGTVRQIKTARIRNVRDVGGWTGLDGKKVKYGLLFRGAELKNKSSDLKAVEQEDYQTLVNDLGISLDIDLRGTTERGGINWSPLGISYLHLPLSPYVWALQDPNRALYAKGIRALLENIRNGQASYVHCQAGADRTGTFVLLVNGLLGVSESDLCKDYEITTYYTERARDSENYKGLINGILGFCSSERDLNEGIYNAVLSMGITEEEIAELRQRMLE